MNHNGHGRLIAVIILVVLFAVSTFVRPAKAQSVHPIWLSIPSIKAEIPVVNVGVTKTGSMDVPNNYIESGWYEKGTLPGLKGSAVIDGHVDSGGYLPTTDGVFKHLREVEIGQEIKVVLSNGSAVRFKVTDISVYSRTSFPATKIFTENDDSYLKIITCHGKWQPFAKTYSDRLVVTAVKIS